MKIEITLIDDGRYMSMRIFDKARAVVTEMVKRFEDSVITYHVRPKIVQKIVLTP